ncbi:hypothetical protein [Aureimonas sp. SK2]|uniref:hypothetical protein n=1 Tax=Aureimonas sp. SK2 TaxID=3015992 RepID=UPI002443CB9B|nr:hypothetical protein [Aureimonas sp. SK2]
MRTIRLHLVGILLALVGLATSMPQPPLRHHAHALRSPAQIQLDDDDQRDDTVAILEDEDSEDERDDGRPA